MWDSVILKISSVQLLSHVQLFVTPWTAAHQASLSITKLQESTQTHVHCVGDAIQPSPPLSSPLFLPSIFPNIRVFSNESALRIRWTKYWSFSFNVSPSNEHPGLISFRMDWLDLAVQGTLKSLLQHHSLKASFLQIKLLKRSLAHWGIKWIHGSVFLSYLITIYYFGIYFYIAIL